MKRVGAFQAGHSDLPARWPVKDRHFENVYNQYYWKIYRICRRYSSKPDEAQDLTHDVFMRYFQNFESFRHESSPSTWMYRVAVNLGIQRWRKEKLRYLDDEQLEAVPAGVHEIENGLLNRIALTKILDRCPERTRKIISLFHIERMSQVEIGKLLGISRATVTRHLVHIQRYRQARPVGASRAGRPRLAKAA